MGKEQAMMYFANEIYQFNIILAGVISPEYRQHILDKRDYYTLAILYMSGGSHGI